MDGDKFISSVNSTSSRLSDSNFFMNSDNISVQNSSTDSVKHINDYDFNILKDDAYKEVDDRVLKLEYKISKAEEEMTDISSQIQAARDINDYDLAESLQMRKKTIEAELSSLINTYKNLSISSKISSGLTSKISKRLSNFNQQLSNFTNFVLSKLPGNFSNLVEIKSSLSKLENINKTVDELMTMHIPYGESPAKYEQLSKYILKANSIQSEISRILK